MSSGGCLKVKMEDYCKCSVLNCINIATAQKHKPVIRAVLTDKLRFVGLGMGLVLDIHYVCFLRVFFLHVAHAAQSFSTY